MATRFIRDAQRTGLINIDQPLKVFIVSELGAMGLDAEVVYSINFLPANRALLNTFTSRWQKQAEKLLSSALSAKAATPAVSVKY